MLNRNIVRRAPLMALFGVLLMLLPAAAQTPLPLPEAASASPRVESQHTMLSYPGRHEYDTLGFALDASGTGNETLIVAGSRMGFVQTFMSLSLTSVLGSQVIESPITGDTLFGRTVAITGTGIGATLVVGAEKHAYVYILTGAGWVLQADLTTSAPASAFFGSSVAISGTGDSATIAVGAYGTNASTMGGAAYIFTRSGSVWSQEAMLSPSTSQANQRFGKAVALAGMGDDAVLVVGADGYNGSVVDQGRAYVFERSGGLWSIRTPLTNPEPATSSFGRSVDVVASGSEYTVAAAAANGDSHLSAPGFLAVYNGSPAAVTLDRLFKKSDFTAASGFIGRAASLSGTPSELMLGFGAPLANPSFQNVTLAAKRSGGVWSPLLADPSYFVGFLTKEYGFAVAMSGVGIGATFLASPNEGSAPGEFVAYRLTASGYLRFQDIVQNLASLQDLGRSVALIESGGETIMAAGAPYSFEHGDGSGAVRVFDRVDGAWQSTAVLNNPTFEIAGLFGNKVALAETEDQFVLAVAAVHNEFYTTPSHGEVFIYTRPKNAGGPPGAWSAPVKITRSDSMPDDWFGSDIALVRRGNGLVLAVGAPRHTPSAGGSGAIYVFEFDGANWSQQQMIALDGLHSQGFNLDAAVNGTETLLAFSAASIESEKVVLLSYDGTAWSELARFAPLPGEPSLPLFDLYGNISPNFGAAMRFRTAGEYPQLAVGFVMGANSYEGRGAVYVYERPQADWTISARIQPESVQENSLFGAAINWSPSPDQAVLAVGAPAFVDSEYGFYPDMGRVFLFTPVADEWLPFAIFSPNEKSRSKYGSAVALEGTRESFTLAVGEPRRSTGVVHVYEHIGLRFTGADDLAVSEADDVTDSYTIALPTRPTANVDIIVTADDQCTLNDLAAGEPLVLTVAPAAWNVPQTVTVTAVDDSDVEGDHECQIEHSVVSADPGYGSLTVAPVEVAVTDDDETSTVQPLELLTNGGFESALTPAWKVKNAAGDKRFCGAKGDDLDCAFRFKGNAGSPTRLIQRVDLTALTLPPVGLFEFEATIDTRAGRKLTLKIVTAYADGSSDSFSVAWSGAAGYQTRSSTFAQALAGASSLTLTVTDKNVRGKIWLDDVSLTIIAARGVVEPPPPAPSDFRRTD